MHLKQFEASLPNGLHDTLLERIAVGYVARTACIGLQVCMGGPDSPTEEGREDYRTATLCLSGLVYFVIDAPDALYPYTDQESMIDVGVAGAVPGPPSPIPVARLPQGAFAYWIFVSNWNSFIHFAAADASLTFA
jgi:hypothetical protein